MMLGVSEGTLRNWERGCAPHVASYPRIVEFLGVEPWPTPETLPQKLRAARYRRGLNVSQTGAVLGVDPSTVWWWEAGRRPHLVDHRRRISTFIANDDEGQVVSQSAEGFPESKLGAAIRQRRQDLGLTLENAARSFGVSPWTLMNWEHDRCVPTDRYYPILIRFLGHDPWPEPTTVAERLRAARLGRGLSQEQAAAMMQVNPDSISDWEAGRVPRHHLSLAKIEAFVTGAARPRRRARKGDGEKGRRISGPGEIDPESDPGSAVRSAAGAISDPRTP